MPSGVYKRKPKSVEDRKRQAEAMRKHWASLKDEERQVIGDKISVSLTGKKQSESHRKANSESHKGKSPTKSTREKLSKALKKAYVEGRKQPVQSSHRKGVPHTEEAKEKIRKARKNQVVWNKGLSTGPMIQEIRDKISLSMQGKPHPIDPEKNKIRKKKISEAKKGVPQDPIVVEKRAATLRRLWAEGKMKVPVASGYGKGCYYESPCQGKIWLRSTSELQYARELDANKSVWFYEAERFLLVLNGKLTTYTPDFWVFEGLSRDKVIKGQSYLDTLQHCSGIVRIEDVKGWWKPSHKTYPKIQKFQEMYPEKDFHIVIRKGLSHV